MTLEHEIINILNITFHSSLTTFIPTSYISTFDSFKLILILIYNILSIKELYRLLKAPKLSNDLDAWQEKSYIK